MPDRERYTQRPTRVSSRRLDPDVLERHFAQHSSVRHTVQSHTTGQAEILHTRLSSHVLRHLQHHLFGDQLDAAREVHLALGDRRFRLAIWHRYLGKPRHATGRDAMKGSYLGPRDSEAEIEKYLQ